jgi:Family of unknown function (DUF5320)
MPGFNGTGPMGQGQGTGWGRGPCGAGLQRGFGRRRGGPCGWGYGFRGANRVVSAGGTGYGSLQDETGARRDEKAYLEGELKAIQKRLAELDEQT